VAGKAFAKSGAVELTSPSPEPEAAVKTRILLAEDNIINQKVALGQLRKLGYAADAVANGLEVLEALKRISYDIILMDCHMPEMDGYGATQAIRKSERSRNEGCTWKSPLHIIALTADAMEANAEKCLRMGMNDYLSKPVSLKGLVVTIDAHLHHPAATVETVDL